MGIDIRQLSYQYRDQWQDEKQDAIHDISFSLEKGEYVALIGHTGSGKSTLLQHLNGLLKPNSGSYYFDGENVYDASFSMQKLRQKVALCFQYPEYQLFEETVLKDIAFGPKNMGYSETESVQKARETMKLVGLSGDMEQQSPFSLSGGQKRRVALAGILAMEPEYLILDEPVAGLDGEGKDNLFSLLKHLNQEKGVTILLVSHDMDDVAANAKRVLVMNHGKLVMDGTTEEIFAQKAKLEAFGLSVPQTIDFYFRLKEKGYFGSPSWLKSETTRGNADKADMTGKVSMMVEEQTDMPEKIPMTIQQLADMILTQKR